MSVIPLIPVIISPLRINCVSVLKTSQKKKREFIPLNTMFISPYYTSYLSLKIPSTSMLIPQNLKY